MQGVAVLQVPLGLQFVVVVSNTLSESLQLKLDDPTSNLMPVVVVVVLHI